MLHKLCQKTSIDQPLSCTNPSSSNFGLWCCILVKSPHKDIRAMKHQQLKHSNLVSQAHSITLLHYSQHIKFAPSNFCNSPIKFAFWRHIITVDCTILSTSTFIFQAFKGVCNFTFITSNVSSSSLVHQRYGSHLTQSFNG